MKHLTLPGHVVKEDHKLEGSVHAASEQLAELRWHWTLDESNPERVSFRQYAEDVGKHYKTITDYVNGYVLYAHSDSGSAVTLTACIEMVKLKADTRMAVEAVAKSEGLTFQSARRLRKGDVDSIRLAVANESEREAEKGHVLTDKDKEEYANTLAQSRKNMEKQEAARRKAAQERYGMAFQSIDTELLKARQHVRKALRELLETPVTGDEEVMILSRNNQAVKELTELFGSALEGDSGTDWDAELASLEHRRNYG